MIVRSIAPLRISFAGGGTDIAEYSREHGGAVISSTINYYSHTHLKPSPGPIRLISLDFGTDEKIEHFAYDGKNDLVKATLKKVSRSENPGGAELFMHTDAPPGSGLGASSAVVVSLMGALNNWLSQIMGDYETAEFAYEIERKELGIKGGYQDQLASTFGGFNYIEFLKDGRVIVNPLRLGHDTIKELECHLLLCYTGTTRLSTNIIDRQIRDFKDGRNVEALHQQKKMAFEMKNTLLKSDLDDFGLMLDEAWQSKKGMAEGITTPEIDKLYDAAKSAGAVGGKILGAGGGGYILLYCDYRKRHEVESTMRSLRAEPRPFSFVKDGLTVWRTKNEL
jgi:D-glycero-alpha-D-manno-heptose-7-phosphate kinase